MKRIAVLTGVAIVGFASLTGCAKMSEPFKDAPRGETNNSPADTITMPDGFSNISTKCVDGIRYSVIYHADSTYGSLSTVVDPNCP